MKGFQMKTMCLVMISLIVVVAPLSAQFKSQVDNQPSASQSLVHPSINSFLGILNPDNFSMRHSLSMSYMSFGGGGISLASYTNSMFYKIADPLNVQLDLTLQGSPFGSYGNLQQNDLSKLFVSRAQLNYKPADNMFIRVEYDQLPVGNYYFDRYSPYRSLYGDQ